MRIIENIAFQKKVKIQFGVTKWLQVLCTQVVQKLIQRDMLIGISLMKYNKKECGDALPLSEILLMTVTNKNKNKKN